VNLKVSFCYFFAFIAAICSQLFTPNAPVIAQDTPRVVVSDTPRVKSEKTFRFLPENHSPKFAGIASAIIPGAGQVYNKKYWKVPIVYAGLATAGYFIYYNYTIYSNFHTAYNLRIDGDTLTNLGSFTVWQPFGTQTIYLNNFDGSQLLQVETLYRRYLDISVLVTAAVYMLNIIDAVVDAHLYSFDVSDDLSLNMKPFIVPGIHAPSKEGLTLTLTFR